MKKKQKINGMVLFSCEKWKPEKCRGVQPCEIVVPLHCKKINGCPLNKKGTWKKVPTTRLTV